MSAMRHAGVVHRLEGHAGGHRAVADDGDAPCGARPCSLAATAMPSAAEIEVDECAVPKVSYSLSSRRGKPEMPPSWRSVRHAVAPAGEDLVRIGLVADVPDEAVVRRVEDVVQRDGQLDRAEVATTGGRRSARRSAARTRAARRRSVRQLGARQAAQVGGLAMVDGCRAALLLMRGRLMLAHQLSRSTTRSASTQQARRRPDRCAPSAACAWCAAASSARCAARRRGRARRRRSACCGRRPCRRSCRASPSPGVDVEHVVDDLEGEADGVAVVGERAPSRRRRRGRRRRPCRTLACSSAPVLRRCMSRSACSSSWQADAGQVDGLAAGHAGAARPRARAGRTARACSAGATCRRPASAPRRPAPAWRRRRASPGPRRTSRARWACRGAGRRCPCTAGRRAPASRRGSARRRRPRAAPPRASPWHGLGRGQHQQRAQALAAVEHGVAHRRRRGRPGRSAGHPALERRLDAASSASQRPGVERSRSSVCHAVGPGLQLAVLEDLHLLLDGLEPDATELQQLRCRAGSRSAGPRAAAGPLPSRAPALRARARAAS